ncbi:MAG: MFS transporter [Dehalococcoidia bacterium]
MDTTATLFATKALRTFGDGMMAILIARYADTIGLSGIEAGAIGTAALVGTALATFLVGRYTERLGRRRVLLWGAILAAATGLGYAASTAFLPLLAVAFLGTANPTSGDVSAFLPVEQAILAQEAPAARRVTLFAWFNVAGSLAGGLGALASGLTGLLGPAGLSAAGEIRWFFAGYAFVGIATLWAVARLPQTVELRPQSAGGTRPGLGRSRRRVFGLAGLFATDSFAGGLIVQSMIALYLLREFDLDPAVTGAVFFLTSWLQAASFLLSARLSLRFGLVNTMVFTHLPSNALLALVAFAPTAPLAIAALAARSFLSQMDVPPRQALVVSVVEPEERAAAAAYTGLTRSLASTPGPSVGGALLGVWGGAPFVVCAGLKSAYDLALWASFRRVEPRS